MHGRRRRRAGFDFHRRPGPDNPVGGAAGLLKLRETAPNLDGLSAGLNAFDPDEYVELAPHVEGDSPSFVMASQL